MNKKYSFPDENTAKGLILSLAHKENELPFNKVTGTKTTRGIACLGFQHIYEYNEETEETVLIKESKVYDVDVAWKDEPSIDWLDYEVEPRNPKHNFY